MDKRPKYPNRFAEMLKIRGLTQADVMRITGENKQTVWKLFHGQTKFSKDWAVKLVPVFGLSWSDVLLENDRSINQGKTIDPVEPMDDTPEDVAKVFLFEVWGRLKPAQKNILMKVLLDFGDFGGDSRRVGEG